MTNPPQRRQRHIVGSNKILIEESLDSTNWYVIEEFARVDKEAPEDLRAAIQSIIAAINSQVFTFAPGTDSEKSIINRFESLVEQALTKERQRIEAALPETKWFNQDPQTGAPIGQQSTFDAGYNAAIDQAKQALNNTKDSEEG